MERARVAVALGIFGALTACGGAGDASDAGSLFADADTTPAEASSSAAGTVTTAVPTTVTTEQFASTATTTTAPPPTTSTSTSTSTTTTTIFATPSTLYPPEDPRAAVAAAFVAGQQQWVGCLAALATCDPAALAAFRASPDLDAARARASELAGLGAVAERTEQYRVQVADVVVTDTTATVTACTYDPIRLVRPATGTMPEEVIADAPTSRQATVTMTQGDDGAWRQTETAVVAEAPDESLCPPPVDPNATTTTVTPESTLVPTSTTAFPTPPTIYAPDDPRAEVEQALVEHEQQWIGCANALPYCPVDQLPNTITAPALAIAVDLMTNLNNLGYQSERANEYRLQIREVTVDGASATVQICTFDPVYIFKPDPAGGPDAVFSDTVTSSKIEVKMLRGDDGRWRQSESTYLETVDGDALCPA